MKQLIASLLLLVTCYLLQVSDIAAQSSTSSATPSPTKTDTTTRDLIDNLKERIASRVAQLKLVEKRGTIGIVTEVSDTQITLADLKDNTRFVDVDELTKFSSPSEEESFGISDIKKGDILGVLGLYNKQSRRILGRFVDVITIKKFVPGTVTSADKENFAITLVTEEKKTYIVDIERITKTFAYTKDDDLIKSGFSKLAENQHVLVVGFADSKDKNLPAGRQGRIIASRIIIFPQIPKNPEIEIPKNVSKPTPTPKETPVSTGSGKKLTPITR